MSSYRQLFKSTGLLGSVQALYIVIAVVRNKVAALLIGPAGMGLADLYARTLELVGNGTNFGLGLSAVKRLAEVCREGEGTRMHRARLVRLVRTWVLLTALLGTAVCLVLAPLLGRTGFGGGGHTLDLLALAPAVGFTTLAGGEIALLKALGMLKALARATLFTALITLAGGCTFYGLWGMRGIVPLLLLAAAATFGCHLREAIRRYPYSLGPLARRFLREGAPLLRLGTAYILAGLMTSAAELAIRAYLSHEAGGLATVGLYAAGLTLTVTYARLLLSALDADYFPRLSVTDSAPRAANVVINRQINTLVVLMTPFLIAFCLILPWVVRLLYTHEFMAVIPMVVAAAPYMFFKAIYTPVAYLPLARGHSLLYMGMELSYDIIFCLSVILGYEWGGLWGAGLGLSAANLCDLIMVGTVYRLRYGYRPNRATWVRCLLMAVLLAAGLTAALLPLPIMRWGLGLTALFLTLPAAWPILRKLRR